MKRKILIFISVLTIALLSLLFLSGCGKKDYTVRIRKSTTSENPELEIGSFSFTQKQIKSGIKALSLAEKAIAKIGKKPSDFAVNDEEFLEWTINGKPCREFSYLNLETKHYNITMFFKEKKTSSTIQYFTKTGDAPASKEYGDFEIRLPLTLPGYDGYEFIGWKENNEGEIITVNKFQMVREVKHKMYAVYMKREEVAKITMLRFENTNPQSFTENQVLETFYTPLNKPILLAKRLDSPFIKNHTFDHWMLDGKPFDITKDTVTADMVLLPRFKANEHKKLVFEDLTNTTEIKVFKDTLIKESENFNIPVPLPRENQEFICWTRKDTSDNKAFSFEQYLFEDITLIPVFKKVDDTIYKIHLPNGVTETIIRPNNTAPFTIPFFQMPYYAFLGYYTDQMLTTPFKREQLTPSANSEINLYPKYHKIIELFNYEYVYDSRNEIIGITITDVIDRASLVNAICVEIPETISDNYLSNRKIIGIKAPIFKGLSALEDIIIHPCLKIIEDDETFNGTPFFDKIKDNDIIKFNNILFKVKDSCDVTIDDKITYITKKCFYNNNKIKQVTIPESCLGLGEFAFTASTIEEITLPKNINTLSQGLFKDCTKLVTVNLENVTIIETDCFNGCINFYSYEIKGDNPLDLTKVELFGDRGFKGCQKLAFVKVNPNLNVNSGLYYKNSTRTVFGEELFRQTEFEYRMFNGINYPENHHRDLLVVNGVLLQINPARTSDIYIGLNTTTTWARIDAINKGAANSLRNIKIYLYPSDDHKNDMGVSLIASGAFSNLSNCTVVFASDNARKYMKNCFENCFNTIADVPFTEQTLPSFFEKGWDNSVQVLYK